MRIPGVRTLAHAELGTRPSSVMRRPWKRGHTRNRRVPPPRGTPAVHADPRAPRMVARLSLVGWVVLLVVQLGTATAAGTTYLAATVEPEPAVVHELPALVPLVPLRQRRTRARSKPVAPVVAVAERPSMDAVLDAVSEQTDAAEACMRSAIVRGNLVPATSYRFNLDWVITPSGAVHSAHVATPSGVSDDELATCLTAALSAWRFPTSRRGVTVRRFPFHFTVR